MGVVNVTPDSFSDGGRYLDARRRDRARARARARGRRDPRHRRRVDPARRRPGGRGRGAAPGDAGDRGSGGRRLARPRSRSTPPRAGSRPAALAAGATLVNDVTAFRAIREIADVVAQRRRRLLPDAHARRPPHDAGRPALRRRRDRGQGVPRGAAGVRRSQRDREERIMLDPGIGFGKTVAHNLELLRRLDELVALGRPLVIGTSRKSFLGKITGREVDDRIAANDRHQRARLRARSARVPRARRGSGPRRARGDGCYGHRAMADDPTSSTTYDDDDDDEGHPEPEVTIEISGLSLFTHVGVTAAEREMGQRLLLDLRHRRRRLRRDRHRPDRGHGRLRARSATSSTWSPSSAPTRRSSGCARRSPTGCSSSTTRTRCGSRPPSPSRRSRCPSPRCRSRSGARPNERPSRPGYLGLGSNVGDRRGHLERAVGGAAGARRDGARLLLGVRDRAGRRWCSTSASSSTPASAIETEHDPERAARRVQGRSSATLGPRGRAACATGRARSTSTCCCSGRSSTRSERLTLPHPEVSSRRLRARAAARARPGPDAARRAARWPTRSRRSPKGQAVRRVG